MPRLLIHVGDCKAGSTSIQRMLQSGAWRAPDEAARTGGPRPLRYATTGRDAGLNHHALANALFVERAMPRRAQLYGALAEEFAEMENPALTISSERFEFAPPAALAESLDRRFPGVEIALIAYVRPHAERLVSGYAQQVKQGLFAGDLEAFHEATRAQGRFLYAPRLKAWREAFGDRLTLRPMMRDRLAGGCVVRDFLDWALGDGAVPTREIAANPSPGVEDLSLLRDLHARLGDRAGRAAARLAESMEATPRAEATRLALHAGLAERVAEAYAQDAAETDAILGGGDALSTALAAAPERPSSARSTCRRSA